MFKKQGFKRGVLLAAVFLAYGTAHAQSQSYADRMNLLEAQIQLAQKQEQLNAALSRQVDPALSKLPQVVAVMGMEGALKARLLLGNGVVHTYSEGDAISPNLKVAAITTREVVVAFDRKTKGSKPMLTPLAMLSGAAMDAQNAMTSMNAVNGVGSPAPLPIGMMPTPAPINMSMPVMPQPIARAPGAPTAPAAVAAPAAANAPAAPAAPQAVAAPAAPVRPGAAAQGARPDQDLIDAAATQGRR